jgi:predicted O-methyltransferase YrrM
MRPEDYKNGLIDLINYINSFSDTKNMRMLEIGTYAGESTLIFSNYFKHVTTIDPYIDNYDSNDPTCSYISLNEVYKKFLDNTKQVDNINLIKKTSDDAILELSTEVFDFIYIVGVHTYEQVKKDIKNYIKLINKNGFIGGHDYHQNWVGVINAVNEELHTIDKHFKDTSWIKRL